MENIKYNILDTRNCFVVHIDLQRNMYDIGDDIDRSLVNLESKVDEVRINYRTKTAVVIVRKSPVLNYINLDQVVNSILFFRSKNQHQ